MLPSSNLGLIHLLGACCFRVPLREIGYPTDPDGKMLGQCDVCGLSWAGACLGRQCEQTQTGGF